VEEKSLKEQGRGLAEKYFWICSSNAQEGRKLL
jgi:hypothetical protein